MPQNRVHYYAWDTKDHNQCSLLRGVIWNIFIWWMVCRTYTHTWIWRLFPALAPFPSNFEKASNAFMRLYWGHQWLNVAILAPFSCCNCCPSTVKNRSLVPAMFLPLDTCIHAGFQLGKTYWTAIPTPNITRVADHNTLINRDLIFVVCYLYGSASFLLLNCLHS